MSTNCLKTQLKGSVINSNLPIFDAIIFPAKNAANMSFSTLGVRCVSGETVTVSTENNEPLYSTSGVQVTLPATANSLTFDLKYGSSDGFNIIMKNKYNIDTFNINQMPKELYDGAKLDWSQFFYCINLSIFKVYKIKAKKSCDVSDFKDISHITELNIGSSNIYCKNIATLGRITTAAHTLLLESPKGTFEDLIDAYIANGVQNNHATIYIYNTNEVTYKNEILATGNSNKYDIYIVNGALDRVTLNDEVL